MTGPAGHAGVAEPAVGSPRHDAPCRGERRQPAERRAAVGGPRALVAVVPARQPGGRAPGRPAPGRRRLGDGRRVRARAAAVPRSGRTTRCSWRWREHVARGTATTGCKGVRLLGRRPQPGQGAGPPPAAGAHAGGLSQCAGGCDLLDEVQRLWGFPHAERERELARIQRWLGTYGPDVAGTRRTYDVAPLGLVGAVSRGCSRRRRGWSRSATRCPSTASAAAGSARRSGSTRQHRRPGGAGVTPTAGRRPTR